MERWTDTNAIYQIYPRSFNDENGDGIGDLAGITAKLEYLKGHPDALGIDAIWLSPFYTSPMRDFGYDISDYRQVDPMFGTLADFDAMVARAHELDIAVMIDFVPNHTSSDHPWFQEALANPESDKRDYYVFRPARNDGTPPNNWLSVFGGSAWTLAPQGEGSEQLEYYCHSFLPEQPDLNWQNPQVQAEMKDILRFWFERGVDGIRVDAIRWMGKDRQFRDDPPNPYFHGGDDPYHLVRHTHSRFSPELDEYLRCMTEVAREYENRIIIFEDHLDDLTDKGDQIRRIYSIDPEVSAPFNFQGMHIPFSARAFGDMVTSYQGNLPDEARAFYCFSNHDESRVVSRFGSEQARMLSVLQLMLPGTPVMYYGQEIGMRDGVIPKDRVQDPFELRVPGRGLGRDPERTPMQWDDSKNAGFTTSERPWLPVNASYPDVNVAHEQTDETSFLALYKKLLELRKNHPVLRSENYQTLHIDDSLFAFQRADRDEEFMVLLNFSEEPRVFETNGHQVIVSAQNSTYEPGVNCVAPLDGIVLWRSLR